MSCRIRLILVAIVLLTAFATLPTGASAAKHKRPVLPGWGVNSGAAFAGPEPLSEHLQLMRSTGLTHVRLDASWGGIQRTEGGPYHWEQTDVFVAGLAQAGLRWYAMIGYSATWASSVPDDPFGSPRSDEEYAAFAGALAERYGTYGAFWDEHPELPRLPIDTYEIWNEPNTEMFWRDQKTSPGKYARLYRAARAAIYGHDPQARIAAGSILDSGADGGRWLTDLLAADPTLPVSVLSWHPYKYETDRVLDSIRTARRILDDNGRRHVPLDISEIGIPALAEGPPIARRTWASMTLAVALSDCRIARYAPYVWTGAESEPGSADWRLWNMDRTPKPAGLGYRDAISVATRAKRIRPACSPVTRTSSRGSVRR